MVVVCDVCAVQSINQDPWGPKSSQGNLQSMTGERGLPPAPNWGPTRCGLCFVNRNMKIILKCQPERLVTTNQSRKAKWDFSFRIKYPQNPTRKTNWNKRKSEKNENMYSLSLKGNANECNAPWMGKWREREQGVSRGNVQRGKFYKLQTTAPQCQYSESKLQSIKSKLSHRVPPDPKDPFNRKRSRLWKMGHCGAQ